MTKKEKIAVKIAEAGIMVYLLRCIVMFIEERGRAPFWDYLGLVYMSPFGVVLLLSVFCLTAVLVSKKLRKREEKGLKPFSKAYRISFLVSFVPYLLFLAYCIYSSIFGFHFFGVSYGWQAFEGAFAIVGLIFCVIPVFPFCLFWQVVYIVKCIRNKKHEIS